MHRITLNGATFEYFEQGSGEPLIFVHGAPSDYRTWLPHCSHLADRRRSIAYTQRYFGGVPWGTTWPAFGLRTHADDLIALAQHIGSAVNVVAWSYGGHAALTAAVERPELFRAVFIYEPGVPTYVADPGELANYTQDANEMFGPVFAARSRGDNEGAVRILLDGSGQRAGYFESQSAERRNVQLANARVIPLLLTQAPPPVITSRELGALKAPVAVAWGARTRPVFGVVARAAARLIGGTAYAEIPGATHMWPEEAPEAFADFAVERLERLRS